LGTKELLNSLGASPTTRNTAPVPTTVAASHRVVAPGRRAGRRRPRCPSPPRPVPGVRRLVVALEEMVGGSVSIGSSLEFRWRWFRPERRRIALTRTLLSGGRSAAEMKIPIPNRDAAHARLKSAGALHTDPSWTWSLVASRHYTECREYSTFSSVTTSEQSRQRRQSRPGIAPRTRRLVLSGDDFTCKYCGRSVGWLTSEDTAARHALRAVRNPITHFRPLSTQDTIELRSVTSSESPHSIMEADARSVMNAVLQIHARQAE